MSQFHNGRPGTVRWAGFIILLCLAGIAAGVFCRQFSFNPAVLVATTSATASAPGTLQPATPAQSEPAVAIPPDLAVLSAPESFSPDTLYVKIDGNADLYLTAGFVQLQCQRFSLKTNNEVWMEWSVYDMGALPQAFSVFSLQRRAEAQTWSLTPFACQTKNALYFVSGRYYVEAVTAMPTEAMMTAMRAMAGQFVAAHPPGAMRIPELELFPPENLEANSQNLQAVDAFGFNGFTNVFAAKYSVTAGTNQAEAIAFFEAAKTPAGADALRDAYRSFLVANGGSEVAAGAGAALGKPIADSDGVEIVFSLGNFVAGVRAAPDAATAATIAQQLADRLQAARQGGRK